MPKSCCTVTVKLLVVVLPAPSVAEHVTVVVPTGKACVTGNVFALLVPHVHVTGIGSPKSVAEAE